MQTAVTEIGTKSFVLRQQVIDLDTGTLRYAGDVKCVCSSVMVAYDVQKHESVPLAEKWVEAMCRFEGHDLRRKKR